jgi:NhaP-type Na+/H+ or K+/H+ antiporter
VATGYLSNYLMGKLRKIFSAQLLNLSMLSQPLVGGLLIWGLGQQSFPGLWQLMALILATAGLFVLSEQLKIIGIDEMVVAMDTLGLERRDSKQFSDREQEMVLF